MPQLLAALFDTLQQAQTAHQALVGEGVRHDDLHLGTAETLANPTARIGATLPVHTVEEAVARSRSVSDSIADLLHTLFIDMGQSHDPHQAAPEPLAPGQVMLTVRVHDTPQAVSVRERLRQLGTLRLRARNEVADDGVGMGMGVKPTVPASPLRQPAWPADAVAAARSDDDLVTSASLPWTSKDRED